MAGGAYSGLINPSVPNLIFGSRDSALTETDITSITWNAEFQITTKGAEISSMGGASSLVNYSSIGLAQSLLKAETLLVTGGSSFNVTVSGSSSDQNTSVKQVLLDGDTKIATLNYAIGGVARDLAINNIDSFKDILDYDKESDTLKGYVWGKEYTYNQNGIAWHSQDNADNKGYEHMWTMSLLTGVEINDGCTLTLDGLGKEVSATKVIDGQNVTVTKTQTWSAKVSGSGNITYIGDYGTSDEQRSKDDNLLNIESVLIYADAEGNTYDDKNDYTGTTSITNLTVNLLKDASLGETSKLTITDANVNLAHEGTEIVGKKEQTELSLDVSGDSELSLVDKSRLSVTGDANLMARQGSLERELCLLAGP